MTIRNPPPALSAISRASRKSLIAAGQSASPLSPSFPFAGLISEPSSAGIEVSFDFELDLDEEVVREESGSAA